MIPKPKRQPKYDKILWPIFSEFIRRRDRGICFTCGRKCEGKGYHAGHFIPVGGSGLALKYDERNVHGQCFNCNINLGGNGAVYYRRMLERYGPKVVDELFTLKSITVKWLPAEWIKKIEFYKLQLRLKYGIQRT